MDASDQRQARQRIARIAAFRAELADLEREQAVTLLPEQRAGIEAHLNRVQAGLEAQFGVDVTESAQRISWGIRIASLLGGVAFFAALVLFLHRVWGMLPLADEVLLLAGIPLLLLVAAEFTARRVVDRFYTALLALAAGAALVMGLTILGGILNTTPSPHALLAWAAFAILVAYAYGLRLLLGAGVLLLCAYVAALATSASGGFWANFLMDRPAFLIPVAVIAYAWPGLRAHRDPHDFDVVYRLCGAGATLVALMILAQRGDPCCSWLPGGAREAMYELMGLAASMGVVLHGLRLGRSGLVNVGALGFVVFLYVRLHAWWWQWMPKYLFFFLLGLIAVGLLLVFRRMRLRLSERSAP